MRSAQLARTLPADIMFRQGLTWNILSWRKSSSAIRARTMPKQGHWRDGSCKMVGMISFLTFTQSMALARGSVGSEPSVKQHYAAKQFCLWFHGHGSNLPGVGEN